MINDNVIQPDPLEFSGTKIPPKEYTWTEPWLQQHIQQNTALYGINKKKGSSSWPREMPGKGRRNEWVGGGTLS